MAQKATYFKHSRKILELDVLTNNEPHNRRSAYTWLIENAPFEPRKVVISGGKSINLQAGEVTFSYRKLAQIWGWSVNRVTRFIADTAAAGLTNTRTEHGRLVITLVKYREALDCCTEADTPPNTATDTATNTEANTQSDTEADTKINNKQQNNETTKQRKEGVSSKRKACENLMRIWNEELGEWLPKTIKATAKRITATQRILKDLNHEPEAFRAACQQLAKSDFHTGRDGKWTGGSFDWFCTKNYAVEWAEKSNHQTPPVSNGFVEAMQQTVQIGRDTIERYSGDNQTPPLDENVQDF